MHILLVTTEEVKENHRYKDEKGYSFRKAFEVLGIKTSTFFFRRKGKFAFFEKEKLTKKFWLAYINKSLIQRTKEEKPDILLLLKADTILAETLYEIKKSTNSIIINVFPDNPLYMGKFESILPCHLFFAKDSYAVDAVRKTGYKNIHFLPQCTDPDVHTPMRIKDEKHRFFQSEISLIGSMYPYRLELIKQLKDYKPKIWGKGWQKSDDAEIKKLYMGMDIRGDDKAMAISNSKISLNPHHPLNDIFGVNRRTYDIAACKGFQLADLKEDMHHSYAVNDEIVCYSTLEELREKLNYFINHSDEREIIAEKAYNKTLKYHTYYHRAKEILEYVTNYK